MRAVKTLAHQVCVVTPKTYSYNRAVTKTVIIHRRETIFPPLATLCFCHLEVLYTSIIRLILSFVMFPCYSFLFYPKTTTFRDNSVKYHLYTKELCRQDIVLNGAFSTRRKIVGTSLEIYFLHKIVNSCRCHIWLDVRLNSYSLNIYAELFYK